MTLSSGILRNSWLIKMVKLLKDTHRQPLLFKLRYVKPPPGSKNPVLIVTMALNLLTSNVLAQVCQCILPHKIEGESNRSSVVF